MSSLEDLDLVARAQSNQRLISYLRIALPLISLLCIMLASLSEAPRQETLLVTVLAATGVATSITLWLNWRYKLYSIAIFCLAFAVMNVLSHDHPPHHTIMGWVAGQSLTFLFTYYGIGACVIARRYAIVNGGEWKNQKTQVEIWMQNLSNQRGINAIEFSTGSFWTGYWTYRILNTGDCWLVAKFKKGSDKLAECRVRELNNVSFTPIPSGKWRIVITDKKKTTTLTEIDISPTLPAMFQPFVRPILT